MKKLRVAKDVEAIGLFSIYKETIRSGFEHQLDGPKINAPTSVTCPWFEILAHCFNSPSTNPYNISFFAFLGCKEPQYTKVWDWLELEPRLSYLDPEVQSDVYEETIMQWYDEILQLSGRHIQYPDPKVLFPV